MQEINLMGKKAPLGQLSSLNIQFETAVVGSKSLIDTGTAKKIFTRYSIAGTPVVTDGVVDHPTFGKCYRFNRYTYFLADSLLQFSKSNYRIEIDFVPMDSGRINSVFRSGDNNAFGAQPGILFNLNQYPANYFQVFCQTSSGFTRAYLVGQTNPGQVLERMIITRIGTQLTVENKRTGVKSVTNIVPPATDTYLAFGASDDKTATYSFDGLLKRFQLFIL